MTASNEFKKCPSNQTGVSVLLIGDDDAMIKTSGLLWETLPRFGEIGVMKLAPHSAASSLDPVSFQLLFFHLSATNASEELSVLRELREKNCQQSAISVCVLIVPEASGEIPDSTADFILTQPVTVETMEGVLKGCSFLSEQSRKGSNSSTGPNLNSMMEQTESGLSSLAEPGASVQERCVTVDAAGPSEASFKCGSPLLTNGDLQAFLHSQKEQKRRMQIKKCCERLRELLPFIKCRMDTASTLEMTVKYMSYLQKELPEDILGKVVKALEDNKTGTWYKPAKPPKKRSKANVMRKKPTVTPVPTDENFVDEFIAAHILGRHIQPRKEATQPATEVSPPVMMEPPVDVNSSLAPGVTVDQTSAPFSQTVVMGQTFGQPTQTVMNPFCQPAQTMMNPFGQPDQTMMNQHLAPPVFWKQTFGPNPPVMISQTFAPPAIQNPPMILDQSTPPSAQPLMVNAEFLPPVDLDPVHAPPAQTLTLNQNMLPLTVLSENFAPAVFPNDLCIPRSVTTQPSAFSSVPEDCRPLATVTPWQDPLLSEILYDSTPSLPSLSPCCVSKADNQPPSSVPEPLFSPSGFIQTLGDFRCNSASPYPLQPSQSFLDYLFLPSPHKHQAQTRTGPGSSIHSLAELPTPNSCGRRYTGPADFQIN